MDWRKATEFLDNYYGVPNYSALSEKDKREVHDLTFKCWDVQAMPADSPEDQAKKQRLLDTIAEYKAKKWGVYNGEK